MRHQPSFITLSVMVPNFQKQSFLSSRKQATSLAQMRSVHTENPATPPVQKKWKCMKQCGACCKLGEFEEDVLYDMLQSEKDVEEYLGMIRSDGWCKYFNFDTRQCNCYDTRPRFCRATPDNFEELYGVEKKQFDQFAISCCEFHIANTYGEDSVESYEFDDFLNMGKDE